MYKALLLGLVLGLVLGLTGVGAVVCGAHLHTKLEHETNDDNDFIDVE